jgi:hypothetical protein
LLDAIERCGAIGEPQRVFEMIEEDLRGRLAKGVNLAICYRRTAK